MAQQITGNMELFKNITDTVYGRCDHPATWKPKPYKEGKERYLWTDAFGVCNYITLYYESGCEKQYLDQADALIRDVHEVLGRDRQGARLNRATDKEPLRGGLRIGKPLPEGVDNGDGQYFHYLSKWMFALNTMSLASKNTKYNKWGIQLAESVHKHFVYNTETAEPHLYWKMSVDLQRPLVQSEGNLDPFDGYIAYRLMRAYESDSRLLAREIGDLKRIAENKYARFRSDDPLDLGQALWVSHWTGNSESWSRTITRHSLSDLEKLWDDGYFSRSLPSRLAFREIGATIGLQVNSNVTEKWADRVEQLHRTWRGRIYDRDRDITPVMFCTSLNPGVFRVDYPHLDRQSAARPGL